MNTVLQARPRNFVSTPTLERTAFRALRYLKSGYSVHLKGPAGTGKTTLALHLADLLGRPIMLLFGDDEFKTSDLIGSQSGYTRKKVVDNFIHSVMKVEDELRHNWIDARLTLACREGFTLVYDEFNRSRPEVNNVLLSALEEKLLVLPPTQNRSEYIRVSPHFRAIFTSNPEEYCGVHGTQDALQDRLITINMPEPDELAQQQILAQKVGIDPSAALQIVRLVKAFQADAAPDMISSLRPSLMIATICNDHGIIPLAENADFRDVCSDILLDRSKHPLPEATRHLWDLFNQFVVSQAGIAEQLKSGEAQRTARLHGEDEDSASSTTLVPPTSEASAPAGAADLEPVAIEEPALEEATATASILEAPALGPTLGEDASEERPAEAPLVNPLAEENLIDPTSPETSIPEASDLLEATLGNSATEAEDVELNPAAEDDELDPLALETSVIEGVEAAPVAEDSDLAPLTPETMALVEDALPEEVVADVIEDALPEEIVANAIEDDFPDTASEVAEPDQSTTPVGLDRAEPPVIEEPVSEDPSPLNHLAETAMGAEAPNLAELPLAEMPLESESPLEEGDPEAAALLDEAPPEAETFAEDAFLEENTQEFPTFEEEAFLGGSLADEPRFEEESFWEDAAQETPVFMGEANRFGEVPNSEEAHTTLSDLGPAAPEETAIPSASADRFRQESRPSPTILAVTEKNGHSTTAASASGVAAPAVALAEEATEERIFDFLDAVGSASFSRIETDLGLTRFQVVNALKSMLDQGLIEKGADGQRPSVYQIRAEYQELL